jgi:hypothetical protein
VAAVLPAREGRGHARHDPELFSTAWPGEATCTVLVLEGADHGLNVGVDVPATVAALERYVAGLARFLAETGQS